MLQLLLGYWAAGAESDIPEWWLWLSVIPRLSLDNLLCSKIPQGQGSKSSQLSPVPLSGFLSRSLFWLFRSICWGLLMTSFSRESSPVLKCVSMCNLHSRKLSSSTGGGRHCISAHSGNAVVVVVVVLGLVLVAVVIFIIILTVFDTIFKTLF